MRLHKLINARARISLRPTHRQDTPKIHARSPATPHVNARDCDDAVGAGSAAQGVGYVTRLMLQLIMSCSRFPFHSPSNKYENNLPSECRPKHYRLCTTVTYSALVCISISIYLIQFRTPHIICVKARMPRPRQCYLTPTSHIPLPTSHIPLPLPTPTSHPTSHSHFPLYLHYPRPNFHRHAPSRCRCE